MLWTKPCIASGNKNLVNTWTGSAPKNFAVSDSSLGKLFKLLN